MSKTQASFQKQFTTKKFKKHLACRWTKLRKKKVRSPTIFNSLSQITATPETSLECRKWRSSSTTWESWGRGTVPSNKVSMNWKTGSRQLSTGASLTTRGRLLVRKPMTWSKMSPSRSRCHWLLALISHGLRRINSLNRMKECSKTCSVSWCTKRPTC